jgi:hypothetical protein
VEALLGGDASALRQENDQLQRRLAEARGLMAHNSPAPAPGDGSPGSTAASGHRRSPLPSAGLIGRFSSSEVECGFASPATTATLCGSPDVFASPCLAASQTTLTVDYRDLHGLQQVSEANMPRPWPGWCSLSGT